MQAIFESIFDVAYLVGVVTIGVIMIRRSARNQLLRLFGIAAVILGVGDSFHLVPRMVALWTTGIAANVVPLGVGKLVTSITMTIFYVMVYYIWRKRYEITGKNILTAAIWVLAALRIILCLMPQNRWVSPDAPLSWGILRNIPFATMGAIIIALFAQQAKHNKDATFRFMALAIALSFAFYAPVVLFADKYPLVGMLMIPKTIAYFWIVIMGWNLQKENKKK